MFYINPFRSNGIIFPNLNWVSPFSVSGLLDSIFHFIQILLEHSASKQCRPLSDAMLCSI